MIDISKIISFRKTTEKNDVLKEYVNNINKQRGIFEIVKGVYNHNLQETLKPYFPILGETTSNNQHENYKYEKAKYIGNVIVSVVPDILYMMADSMTALAGNPISIFKIIKGVVMIGGLSPYSVYKAYQEANSIIALKQDNINMLNEYSIQNSNIHALKDKDRKESIKTHSLVLLVIDDEWINLKDTQIIRKI